MPADEIPRNRMDSTGSGCETNGTENIYGSSPSASSVSSLRARTDSEGSDRLTRFILPSNDGSPPKILTLNEISDVVTNIQSMTLAHEIALNPEFKLQPYDPPESSLEHRIKEVMHKAFWDVLREEINSNPPSYGHAIKLLAEIKDCFPQILSSKNKKSLNHINEVLDATLIRQQAERGVLDFQSYANFVISVMAKSCAPARDEEVAKLFKIDNVIDTFRGILEVMALMKLDMANFLLDYARNDILVHSVKYEKQKFKDYLKYYTFGFPATEAWLNRNKVVLDNNDVNIDRTIFNAYMELLDWDPSFDFPEILSNDLDRIAKIRQRALRMCTTASVIGVCSGLSILSQRPANRIELSNQVAILVQSIKNQTDLQENIENVWVQVQKFIHEKIKEEVEMTLDEKTEEALKAQILSLANKDSPVRNLIWRRMLIYFHSVLMAKVGQQPPIPPGYNECKDELENCTITFKRVISYNHSIFGDFFRNIIEGKPYTDNEDVNQSTLNDNKISESPSPSETSN